MPLSDRDYHGLDLAIERLDMIIAQFRKVSYVPRTQDLTDPPIDAAKPSLYARLIGDSPEEFDCD